MRFRDNMGRLNIESYVVLGVSKDSKSHQRFVEKQELNFRSSLTRTSRSTTPTAPGG